MTRSGVTAVILAGGQATRMGGVQKALVPFRGKPLIEHVLARLESQVDQILISGTRDLQAYGKRFELVADEPGLCPGPLAGIESCMGYCNTPLFVSLPCDVPLVPADLVQRLASGLNRSESNLVAAHDGKRWQSLFMMGKTGILAESLSRPRRQSTAIWRWIESQNATAVDFSDCPEAFLNINTLDFLD